MAPVVSMFRIIFSAVPAFIRVEPLITSGPTSATMPISRRFLQRGITVASYRNSLGAVRPRVVDGRHV